MISQLISAETVRRWCLRFPSVMIDHPFGPQTTVYRDKTSRKMFALHWETVPAAVRRSLPEGLSPETVAVNLKAEPHLSEHLRAAHWQITGGYHMNKTHWSTVLMVVEGTLTERLLKDLIEDSYDLVVNGSKPLG
ncbi:MmcQ/YjbR family DNA-binding protein [Micrococcoides hystricis]|uniref:MmcQ/YjbR family DNA-binding protein n=1 Tax=Micrococcoides hystricis TaxID=1572761 RepID=A0ABV6PCR1_9MICC